MWYSVVWAPEIQTFCAVALSGSGDSGGTDRIATSPDGTTWVGRSAPLGYFWYSVCWAPELRSFCAVAGGGTGGGLQWIMTSKIDTELRLSAIGNGSSVMTFTPNSGPTGATSGAQAGWLRLNVNGVDRFLPYW